MISLKNKNLSISCFLFASLILYDPAYATIYFYFDAEDGNIAGTNLPLPATAPNGLGFCGTPCGGLPPTGTYGSSISAPQGNMYFEWNITSPNQGNVRNEVKNRLTFPVSLSLGTTYYLAYWMRFDRKNGLDIWQEGSLQSSDKGVELSGDGIRWTTSRGQWTECRGVSGAFMANADHRFTVWVGNPTYHLNPSLEAYGPNQSGYSCSNTPQLEYERWYSVVLGVKVAIDATGSIQYWLDGTKIIEDTGIQTAASGISPTISAINMGGTMSQPAYDAPPHYRRFDALMLTNNWQDIVDGGYLAGAVSPPPPDSISTPSIPSEFRLE
ncbi:MAG: hypothetical protein SCH71_15570 [Desulfobulbaceae bacterium]|nr:hypothetical protein [Desulfobulbaceae bacterium]